MSDSHRPDADNAQTDEYPVAALGSDIAETIEELSLHPSSVPSSAPPARPLDDPAPKQFTLPMLFALTLVTSVVFALMRTVTAGVFAATLGILLALAPATGMTRTLFGTMLWWTLLGIYSTAVVVLLVTG